MPNSHGSAQAATGAWVDLEYSLLNILSGGIWSFLLKCTVAKSQFRVLASNDENFILSIEDESATPMLVNETKGVGGPAFYRYYKVQIKETDPGGSIEAYGHSA